MHRLLCCIFTFISSFFIYIEAIMVAYQACPASARSDMSSIKWQSHMTKIISWSSTWINNDEVLWSNSDSLFTAEHFGSIEHPSGIGWEKQINFTRLQSLISNISRTRQTDLLCCKEILVRGNLWRMQLSATCKPSMQHSMTYKKNLSISLITWFALLQKS